jgi:hypothetical protein
MDDRWVVKFTLPHGTTGRVARIFTEAQAKSFAAYANDSRADCRYEAIEEAAFGGESCPMCPTRTPMVTVVAWSTFGPCEDGKHHDISCPIARRAMAEARWPCGTLRYPDVAKSVAEIGA